MSQNETVYLRGEIVEEDMQLSLAELCQACSVREEQVTTWVFEGVLEPAGERPPEWRFGGRSLKRARTAMRLARDLEINAPGVALALDLLDQIARLEVRLMRGGGGTF
jgi:chaperone modulatory protein CbpM